MKADSTHVAPFGIFGIESGCEKRKREGERERKGCIGTDKNDDFYRAELHSTIVVTRISLLQRLDYHVLFPFSLAFHRPACPSTDVPTFGLVPRVAYSSAANP